MTPAGLALLRGRAAVRLALAGVLALAGLVCLGGPAAAHATLIDTDPRQGEVLATAPAEVRFIFDEPVRLQAGPVRLFDAVGEDLPVEARSVDSEVVVALPADLPDGSYVLSWRVVSTDAHPIAGSLNFAIGSPSDSRVAVPPARDDAAVGVIYDVLQGLMYLGLFGAAGLTAFLVLLLPRTTGQDAIRVRVHRVLWISALVGGAASVLLVPVTSLNQQGLAASDLLQGRGWTDQVGSATGLTALLIVTGLGVAVASMRGFTDAPRSGMVALAGASLALASLPLVGHPRAVDHRALAVTADLLHVFTGAVWFGGLVGLGLMLPALAKRATLAATTVTRFSSLGAGLLAVLSVAGISMGWQILGSWSSLFGTGYGWILLAKVAVAGLAVTLAVWNRFGLVPRMRRADGFAGRRAAALLLRKVMAVEAGLLAIVVLLTGLLVNQSPAEAPALRASTPAALPQSVLTGSAAGIHMVARVTPSRIGRNTIVVEIHDTAGGPLEPFAVPVVSVASPEVDLGSQPVTIVGTGKYRVETLIPSEGDWTLQVSVRLSRFDNPVVALDLEIPGRR